MAFLALEEDDDELCRLPLPLPPTTLSDEVMEGRGLLATQRTPFSHTKLNSLESACTVWSSRHAESLAAASRSSVSPSSSPSSSSLSSSASSAVAAAAAAAVVVGAVVVAFSALTSCSDAVDGSSSFTSQ